MSVTDSMTSSATGGKTSWRGCNAYVRTARVAGTARTPALERERALGFRLTAEKQKLHKELSQQKKPGTAGSDFEDVEETLVTDCKDIVNQKCDSSESDEGKVGVEGTKEDVDLISEIVKDDIKENVKLDSDKEVVKVDSVILKENVKIDLISPKECDELDLDTVQEDLKIDSSCEKDVDVDLISLKKDLIVDSITISDNFNIDIVSPKESIKIDSGIIKEDITESFVIKRDEKIYTDIEKILTKDIIMDADNIKIYSVSLKEEMNVLIDRDENVNKVLDGIIEEGINEQFIANNTNDKQIFSELDNNYKIKCINNDEKDDNDAEKLQYNKKIPEKINIEKYINKISLKVEKMKFIKIKDLLDDFTNEMEKKNILEYRKEKKEETSIKNDEEGTLNELEEIMKQDGDFKTILQQVEKNSTTIEKMNVITESSSSPLKITENDSWDEINNTESKSLEDVRHAPDSLEVCQR